MLYTSLTNALSVNYFFFLVCNQCSLSQKQTHSRVHLTFLVIKHFLNRFLSFVLAKSILLGKNTS